MWASGASCSPKEYTGDSSSHRPPHPPGPLTKFELEGKHMEFMLALWLPVLLSAAAVWIVSAIAWMALPHHKRDFIGLPGPGGEGSFMEYLRTSGIKPGNYAFPDCHAPGAMKSEKVQKAWQEGPVGHLSVWRTPLTMGDKMVATFVVYLVVSTLIAYLTRVALPGAAGTTPPSFARVFQVAGTAGVLAYCFSFIPNAVWWGSYRRTIVANVVDGLVYGAITGAIFAWLWPR